MARGKKPDTFVDRMLKFIMGKSRSHERQPEIRNQRPRRKKDATEFLASQYDTRLDTRTNHEAYRRLHGELAPTNSQRQRDRSGPAEPAPAHFRKQRDRAGPSESKGTLSRNARRYSPKTETQEEQSKSKQAKGHLQRANATAGNKGRPIRQVPTSQPTYTLKDSDSHKSVHMSDVMSSGSQRTNPSTLTGDRTTRFADFYSQDEGPVSPLLPPMPAPPPLPTASVRKRHYPEDEKKQRRAPICRMCQQNQSTMDPHLSDLGYHLCTECKASAFIDESPEQSPVSPLSPVRTSEARLQQFHFTDQESGRNTGSSSRNNGRSGSRNVTRHASRDDQGVRSKSKKKSDSGSRKLTGQTSANLTHQRQDIVQRAIQNPETFQQAEEDTDAWPLEAHPPRRAPSAGLHPALHRSDSGRRRQPTYSTIFNDRSQAAPAPPLPQKRPSRSNQSPARSLSPPRHEIRHKSSSIYSFASETISPGILPPASISHQRESQMIAPSILPPLSMAPTSHRESQMLEPGLLPPSSIAPPRNVDAIPDTYYGNLPPPLPPRSSSRPFPRKRQPEPENDMLSNHHRNTQDETRRGLPPSPVPSTWTVDWSGYDEETRREAAGVPPMPPIPPTEDEEERSPRRDTNFYGFYDDIVGYQSRGPGGKRRYNQL